MNSSTSEHLLERCLSPLRQRRRFRRSPKSSSRALLDSLGHSQLVPDLPRATPHRLVPSLPTPIRRPSPPDVDSTEVSHPESVSLGTSRPDRTPSPAQASSLDTPITRKVGVDVDAEERGRGHEKEGRDACAELPLRARRAGRAVPDGPYASSPLRVGEPAQGEGAPHTAGAPATVARPGGNRGRGTQARTMSRRGLRPRQPPVPDPLVTRTRLNLGVQKTSNSWELLAGPPRLPHYTQTFK